MAEGPGAPWLRGRAGLAMAGRAGPLVDLCHTAGDGGNIQNRGLRLLFCLHTTRVGEPTVAWRGWARHSCPTAMPVVFDSV